MQMETERKPGVVISEDYRSETSGVVFRSEPKVWNRSRFGSLFICSDMHTSHLHPGAASGFKINSCGSYLRRKQRSEVRYRGFFWFLNHIFCRSLSAFMTSVRQKHRWSALIMDKLSIY